MLQMQAMSHSDGSLHYSERFHLVGWIMFASWQPTFALMQRPYSSIGRVMHWLTQCICCIIEVRLRWCTVELNSKIVWGNYHIPGSTFRICNELAFQHTDVLLLCPRIGLLQSKPSSVLSKKHFLFDIILLVRSCLLISGAVWYVAMIATAFNRYQDLNLVCNDAHFARYLLLEAAIASFGFIACLLLKVAFTSSGFAAYLRLTAALSGSGFVAFALLQA